MLGTTSELSVIFDEVVSLFRARVLIEEAASLESQQIIADQEAAKATAKYGHAVKATIAADGTLSVTKE